MLGEYELNDDNTLRPCRVWDDGDAICIVTYNDCMEGNDPLKMESFDPQLVTGQRLELARS